MSLPPAVVQIKRKREDQAPPETLHIEDHNDSRELKRPRGDWFFQKVILDTIEQQKGPVKPIAFSQSSWERKPPVVRATKPGQDLRVRPSPRARALDAKRISRPLPAAFTSSASITPEPPRRYHLARVSKSTQRTPTTKAGRQGRNIVTFVEHESKTTSSQASFESLKAQASNQVKALKLSDTPTHRDASEDVEGHVAQRSPPRALKRPGKKGTRILMSAPVAFTEKTKFDFGSEALAAEMAKFSLETMAQENPEQEIEANPVTSQTAPRFKPKPPAQRYHERHANDLPVSKLAEESRNDQGGDDLMHTDDYIIDTYVRVPAHTLELVPMDVGVLVIESEEQMQQFYEFGEDSSDDSDLFDEEIDENAEANPNNEYPDEELSSDDEFDLNTYNYSINASDDEEYDFDEGRHSDDGNDIPWGQTFAQRKLYLTDDF